MLREQHTVSLLTTVRQWTFSSARSHLHSFCAAGMSSGRVMSVTLIRVARKGWAVMVLNSFFFILYVTVSGWRCKWNVLYYRRGWCCCNALCFNSRSTCFKYWLAWSSSVPQGQFMKHLFQILAGVVFHSSSRPIHGQYQDYEMTTSFQIFAHLSVVSHSKIRRYILFPLMYWYHCYVTHNNDEIFTAFDCGLSYDASRL